MVAGRQRGRPRRRRVVVPGRHVERTPDAIDRRGAPDPRSRVARGGDAVALEVGAVLDRVRLPDDGARQRVERHHAASERTARVGRPGDDERQGRPGLLRGRHADVDAPVVEHGRRRDLRGRMGVDGRLPLESAGEPVDRHEDRLRRELAELPAVHAEDHAVPRHERGVARDEVRRRVVRAEARAPLSQQRADRYRPHRLPRAGVDLVQHPAPVGHEDLVAHDCRRGRDVPRGLVRPLHSELAGGGRPDRPEDPRPNGCRTRRGRTSASSRPAWRSRAGRRPRPARCSIAAPARAARPSCRRGRPARRSREETARSPSAIA